MGDVVFETERTIVRPWRDAEADRVLDTYSRWEVSKWLGSEPKVMETIDEARTGITGWAERTASLPFGGVWAVERKSDGVVAGTTLLVPLKGGDGEYEVGWHFHPDSWGQGLASESARGCLQLGWDAGLDETFAVVKPGNEPSMAVCRRIGMQHLGLSEKYYDSTLELFRIARP